jgi:uncharacterized protein
MVAAAMLAAALATTQQPPERFQVTVARTVLTGTEEYRVTRTPQGTRITGTLSSRRQGASVTGTQEETLGPSGDLIRYRLDVTVAGGAQTVEAWRDGDSVRMRAAAGGQSREHAVPYVARGLVLDNLVVSHFQVLLDRLASAPAGGEWRLYVPQAFTAITATTSGPTPDSAGGTLDGRPIALRQYVLQAGGNLINVWAEAATNRLMRVTVPIQQVEITRDGFVPGAAPASGTAPAGPVSFVERDFTVSDAGVELPGTLCLPVGAGAGHRVPLVVLVAGSGPNDRDETIGPNKPLAEIAHGLAAGGIATLRYDKRTLVLRGTGRMNVATMTVDQEVIDDAVAAIALGRSLPEVDSGRVYLAGHSLGGTLAPLIAARAPAGSLRGVILLAPGARALDAVVEEQTAMRLRLTGMPEGEIARQVQALRDAFGRVRSGAAADSEIVFFAPAHYWRDLFARAPLATLRGLALPVLVLQGGKDYQATKADYDLVAAALAAKPAALRELRWFPGLNHLFMAVPGEGPSTGAEYGAPGHVDPAVVAAMVQWIGR